MKYLKNIVEKEEVKEFIDKNSESIIDFTKSNFNVRILKCFIIILRIMH